LPPSAPPDLPWVDRGAACRRDSSLFFEEALAFPFVVGGLHLQRSLDCQEEDRSRRFGWLSLPVPPAACTPGAEGTCCVLAGAETAPASHDDACVSVVAPGNFCDFPLAAQDCLSNFELRDHNYLFQESPSFLLCLHSMSLPLLHIEQQRSPGKL